MNANLGPWLVADAIALVACLAFSALGTGLCRSIAPKIGFVDKPATRKLHRSPVPLLGGAAIYASLATLVALGYAAGSLWGEIPSRTESAWAALSRLMEAVDDHRFWLIAGGATVCVAVGLVDDRVGLSPFARLAVQGSLSAAVVLLGVRPEYEFLPTPSLEILAMFWLVGVMNAFNLIDGADGLAGGIALIACITLGSIMLMGNQPAASLLLLALAGGLAGFLIHNFHPARIFLGSSGSLLVGFLLGSTVLIASDGRFIESPRIARLVIPLLTLAVPVYDTMTVVIIRLASRSSIFRADNNHVHHRLMRKGFSHRTTVTILWGISAVICAVSMITVLALTERWMRVAVLAAGTIIPFLILELLPARMVASSADSASETRHGTGSQRINPPTRER